MAIIGGAAAGVVAVVTVPTVILPAVGFTSAGVATGSTAAIVQSTFGGAIASGGVFATCQSIAATGVSAAIVAKGAALGLLGAVSSRWM